ncbi:MAG: GNAT family N-acetyltransferase [Anaerolineae bacterium]
MRFIVRQEATPIQFVDRLTQIYAAAFAPPPYNKTARESMAFAVDFSSMVKRDAFRLVFAIDTEQEKSGSIIGFAYGYHLQREYGWQRVLGPPLEQAGHGHWLTDAYCMAELALLPDYWGMGLGGRLHDALFADLPYSHWILSTMQNNTTNAYQMYHKRGWVDLLENYFVSEIDREYRVMGRAGQ